MKKSTKKRKTGWVAGCLLLLLAAGIVLGVRYLRDDTDTSEPTPVSGAVTEVAKGFSFPIDMSFGLMDLSVNGDIAKIDCIAPGLDTYSMEIVMYDLKTDKEISRTAFEEDLWVTGQTEEGFYVVSVSDRTLTLYDTKGNSLRSKAVSCEIDPSICCLSPDGRYFLYADAYTRQVWLYDFSADTDKVLESIDPFSHDAEYLGFYNDRFYFRAAYGTLTALSPATENKTVLFSNTELTYVFPHYGLGIDEMCFAARSADSGTTVYTPLHSADELVFGEWENGFITTASQNEGNIIRCYDLNNGILRSMEMAGAVTDICSAGQGSLLAAVRDDTQETYRLYRLYPNKAESSAITLSDSSTFQSAQPSITEPSQTESTESTDNPTTTAPGISGSTTTSSTATPSTATPSATSEVLSNVPVIPQFPSYPTGCETISAMMLLKYAGESVTTEDFINNHLPMSSAFSYEGNTRYGPSPWEYFIGNPRSTASFGCMAPVIEKALISYFGSDSRVKNTTGLTLDELCSQYIDQGLPVMVWATIYMIDVQPTSTWYLPDGTRFTWPGNEHCMVLVGYDEQYYYFNDPYAGKQLKYRKQVSNNRHAELGLQSLIITGNT